MYVSSNLNLWIQIDGLAQENEDPKMQASFSVQIQQLVVSLTGLRIRIHWEYCSQSGNACKSQQWSLLFTMLQKLLESKADK